MALEIGTLNTSLSLSLTYSMMPRWNTLKYRGSISFLFISATIFTITPSAKALKRASGRYTPW